MPDDPAAPDRYSQNPADHGPLPTSGAANPLPSGVAATADPNKWYYLRVGWEWTGVRRMLGWMHSVGTGREGDFGRPYWDYVCVDDFKDPERILQFRIEPPDESGYSRWVIRNEKVDLHLDCKATGWLYVASLYNTRFRIVDRQLYMNYRWTNPLGVERRSFLVSDAFYVGADLPALECELEEV